MPTDVYTARLINAVTDQIAVTHGGQTLDVRLFGLTTPVWVLAACRVQLPRRRSDPVVEFLSIRDRHAVPVVGSVTFWHTSASSLRCLRSVSVAELHAVPTGQAYQVIARHASAFLYAGSPFE